MLACLKPPYRWLRIASIAMLATSLAACATPSTRVPPPAALYEDALPSGQAGLRFWADDLDPAVKARASQTQLDTLTRRWEAAGRPAQGLDVAVLALSGGAADGAYGAGLLTGWSDRGDRPSFDVVTGISVGALIAPFAFLGSAYDDNLRIIFNELDTTDVAELQLLRALFGALSLAETDPLRRQIERFIDADFLARIATQHRLGRRLLVGTTNIDAVRPVIWDLGAVAAAGELQLFQDVVLASASIPGAFPPVQIEVEADGQRFTELHVDGGVTQSVFIGPPRTAEVLPENLPFDVRRTFYVVMNLALIGPYKPIEESLRTIIQRSLSTLIRAQSEGDVVRIGVIADSAGAEFRLAFLPKGFKAPQASAFDRDYMRALFARGELDGRRGIPWLDKPPALLGRRAVVDGLNTEGL